jgi:hypothetical protein
MGRTEMRIGEDTLLLRDAQIFSAFLKKAAT